MKNLLKLYKHNKTHFYKYTSTSTAILILENKTFRYSSPLLFNDPFDVQTEINFNFSIKDLPELVFEKIESIIKSDEDYIYDQENTWGQAIALLKNKVKEFGYDKVEVKSMLIPFINFATEIIKDTKNKTNSIWQNDFLPRMRVFSVSEKNDDILMWSHYADFHRGIVFKLNVLPDYGNYLGSAYPIIYKEKPPSFFSKEELIDDIIGIKKIDYEKHYYDYAVTKSIKWSHEYEWRVWDLLPEKESELYSDYQLFPNELSAMYFGCNFEKKEKVKIISLSKRINNEIKFYQAYKSIDDYSLFFEEIQ